MAPINILETEWWSLALPPEWWAESEDDSIFIGDRDEVGCIQITTLRRDRGRFSGEEVTQLAISESEEHHLAWEDVSLGDFSGVRGQFLEEQSAIREWYVAAGPLLLFITYSCDEDNAGMDDSAVDILLDTLLVLPEPDISSASSDAVAE